MTSSERILPAAVFVLLLATFLRFHLLEAQSFWNDEGNSARLSERSIRAILEGTASDIHPPLYYLILRGWRELAGESEFGLRSFSAYTGILTVVGVMALSRWATARRWPAVMTGVFAAVSPVLVYYSQETRMYALLALLAVLSAWVLLNWLRIGPGLGLFQPAGWAAAYTLLVSAGLYTHYFFPAVIVAQGGLMFLWWLVPRWVGTNDRLAEPRQRGYRFLAWSGMIIGAVALYLPWAPIMLRQVGGRSGTLAGLSAFAEAASRWLILGSTVATGEVVWAIFALVALVSLGIVVGRPRSAVPLVLATVPLLLLFLLDATDPAYFKFLLVVVPFLAVLMGIAWTFVPEQKGTPDVTLVRLILMLCSLALTVAMIAGSAVSLANLYNDPAFARADYRGMAARIAAEDHPNAGIILNAPNQWEAFTYYHRDGSPVYPLPRGRPDPGILETELEGIAATHDRIYALYWGERQRDPERVVERWLDANTFKASEEWVGDVRFVIYAVPHEMESAPTPSGAEFAGLGGETLTLQEYAVWPAIARPGDVVQVRLAWSADITPERPYKIFLHLVDSQGNVVAQRDSEPVGGSRPTTSWASGERLVDNHGLLMPADLMPGEYSLQLGWYDAFDPGVRLPVAGGDSLHLGTISVRREN